MSRYSQNRKILQHLEEHGSITSRQAMAVYDIYRLASRINDLRNAGYPITTEMVYETKWDGSTVRYAKYHLKGA